MNHSNQDWKPLDDDKNPQDEGRDMAGEGMNVLNGE